MFFAVKMRVTILCFILVFSLAYCQNRKITSELNPGCGDKCGDDTTLIYVRAEGHNDTLHQIWDFSLGIPTMLFISASRNSTLDIEWDSLKPKSFVMSEIPRYSFGAAIDKVVEYNDTDDSGHYEPKYPQRSYSLSRQTWRRDDTVLTDKEAMVRLHTGSYKEGDKRRSGIIAIKMDLLPFKDYAVDLPHLIHTANSSLVDISLVNMTSTRGFNQSRFAIHFVLVSTDKWDDTMHNTMRKSLDDEHTPGVFEIIEVKTPSSLKSGDGGFMQFRPVAYTQPERSVATSTNAHILGFNRTTIPRASTLSIYFGRLDHKQVLVQDMFISFGEPGDGFYRQRNYTAWSFTIGYGTPPVESFSLFVILIISIGLGVPVVLALSGIVYVLVRRYKQRNAPSRLVDDE